jgi:MOSC domain-containing protein YiiM
MERRGIPIRSKGRLDLREEVEEMPELVSIVYKPEKDSPIEGAYYRVPRADALLIAGFGIEGDAKGGSPYRQLNIMGEETIRGLGPIGYRTGRGQLGENLVVAGVEIESLTPGTRLQIGASAVVELLELRKPCNRFEAYQGRSLQGAVDRIGWMAAVISGGPIAVGDSVAVLAPEPALAL